MGATSLAEHSQTRVLVVSGNAIEREGLVALLRREPSLIVVGAAANAEQALEVTSVTPPEVIILDLAPAGEAAPEAARRLSAAYSPTPNIVGLRRDFSREQVASAFDAGIKACVATAIDAPDLVSAVQAARSGSTYLCPVVSRVLREAPSVQAQSPSGTGRHLTTREREVLALISSGLTDRQIAERLSLAIGTVHTHRKHIMAKLGVRNVTGLLRRARDLGLLAGT